MLPCSGMLEAQGADADGLLTTLHHAGSLDSPRGAFVLGKSHNPVQDIDLRQVTGKENKPVGVASKALADPSRGCRL